MYYIGDFWGQTFIYHTVNEDVMFGPFNDEYDAHFVCEMLNNGKLKMELGTNGEKDIEDTHTVY
jgi:hypothetical protein